MKHKYIVCCMTLSVLLVFSGCRKKEVSKEEAANNQVNSEDHADVQNDTNEQSNDQDDSNESTNLCDRSNETTYFLSANSDFLESLASNPIDQKYIINYDAPAIDILQSSLEKCDGWNQQIDFTSSKLEKLLSKADYDQLQHALSLCHEYYEEEVEQNRALYGMFGLIKGTMYTSISADVLVEKCKFTASILLSQEYELSGKISFAENAAITSNDSEYTLSPQSFCLEDCSEFEEMLTSYSINEMNSEELETLIHDTANKIEKQFEHDFTNHCNKYVSYIQQLYMLESDISKDCDLCLGLKENRLRMYAIELLNLVYMIDTQ